MDGSFEWRNLHPSHLVMASISFGKAPNMLTVPFFLTANGNLCGWWSQTDLTRSCTGIYPCFSYRGLLYKDVLSYTSSIQHYIKLSELEKNRKLNDLLDALDFNQVVIFVKSVSRAAELNKLLVECNFPSICIHSGMSQEERYMMVLWNYPLFV